MSNKTMHHVLTEGELDQLAVFLDSIGPPAMNLESLDGYFCALICGPDMVLPSEYLPAIWGDDFAFEGHDQATDIIGLVMRHWNTIAGALRRALDVADVYMPILLKDSGGVAHCNDWAQGFMRGVQTRPGSWRELIESEEQGGLLLPIMLLAHENDPDPEMRPKPITAEKREEVLIAMIASLTGIYRYFEPERLSAAPRSNPQRRVGPKIGRNDPCPCASGKKYKQCCGAATSTLH